MLKNTRINQKKLLTPSSSSLLVSISSNVLLNESMGVMSIKRNLMLLSNLKNICHFPWLQWREWDLFTCISTDGGTWYPQACRFLRLKHHLHSSLEKSLIERTMQYVKDRTESFDDYFTCRLKDCKLKHGRNWLNLFVDYHNKGVIYA